MSIYNTSRRCFQQEEQPDEITARIDKAVEKALASRKCPCDKEDKKQHRFSCTIL
jgi:hypothetical protein